VQENRGDAGSKSANGSVRGVIAYLLRSGSAAVLGVGVHDDCRAEVSPERPEGCLKLQLLRCDHEEEWVVLLVHVVREYESVQLGSCRDGSLDAQL
jgi:hypothetical protein